MYKITDLPCRKFVEIDFPKMLTLPVLCDIILKQFARPAFAVVPTGVKASQAERRIDTPRKRNKNH